MILFSTLVIEKLLQNIKKKMATFAESQILCTSLSEFYEGYRGGIKSTQEEVLLIINLMIVLEKKINDRKLVGHQDMLECFETQQETLFVQEKSLHAVSIWARRTVTEVVTSGILSNNSPCRNLRA